MANNYFQALNSDVLKTAVDEVLRVDPDFQPVVQRYGVCPGEPLPRGFCGCITWASVVNTRD